MKHFWNRVIDCARPDGTIRTCLKCGAKVRRHRVTGYITASVGPRDFRMPVLERWVYVWSFTNTKSSVWQWLWELPPCTGKMLPRCAATKRVRGGLWGSSVRCTRRRHGRGWSHIWKGVIGGGDGEVVSVEW